MAQPLQGTVLQFLTKLNVTTYAYKNLDTNICNSFIYDHQYLE